MSRTSDKDNLSKEQLEEVKRLQEQIKQIRTSGKFKGFYYDLREATVKIMKSEQNDADKKKALLIKIEQVAKEIKESI